MNRLRRRIENLSKRYGTETAAELTVVVEAPERMPDHEIRSSIVGAASVTTELIVIRRPKERTSEAREIQQYRGGVTELLDHIARHGKRVGEHVPVNR